MTIQFTKLVFPRKCQLSKATPHIAGEKLCAHCFSKPVGGYIGNGTVLKDLCAKCFRQFSSGRGRARSPRFNNLGGKS